MICCEKQNKTKTHTKKKKHSGEKMGTPSFYTPSYYQPGSAGSWELVTLLYLTYQLLALFARKLE